MHQIATTIEQSRRLLERPDIVPADSADMRFYTDMCLYKAVNGQRPLTVRGEIPFWDVDAWSLSALWGILNSFGRIYEFPTTLSPEELIEKMVEIIEYAEPF